MKPRSGSELGGENLLHIIVNFFLQIGLLVLVHNLIEIGIESGFLKALFEIITLQYNYQMDFSFFSLRMKAHYFGHTILHGGVKS